MSNRFSPARCCCGDKPGTGVCEDACVYSWNGCAASAIGDPYITTFDDTFAEYELVLKDVYDNCGWLVRLTGLGGGDNYDIVTVAGSDGDFTVSYSEPPVGVFDNLSVDLIKYFVFNYRTASTLEFETTITLDRTPFQLGTYGEIVSLGAVLVSFSDTSPLRSSTVTSITVDGEEVTDDSFTVKIVITIGDVLATTVNNFTAFDGTNFVENSGCRDLVEISAEVFVDGVSVRTQDLTHVFFGKRCYATCGVGANLSDHNNTFQTSDMTITVT